MMNTAKKSPEIMQIREREILFIYNHNEFEDRKALGYAKSLKHLQIKEFDVTKNSLTQTQVEEITQLLNVHPSEMINEKSKVYQDEYASKEFGRKDILKVLSQKPYIIKTPIAVYNDRADFVDTSYRFVKQDMVNTGRKRNVTNKER